MSTAQTLPVSSTVDSGPEIGHAVCPSCWPDIMAPNVVTLCGLADSKATHKCPPPPPVRVSGLRHLRRARGTPVP